MTQSTTPVESVLKSMFLNWSVGFGSLALLLLLSIYLPMLWLPFIALVEWYGLSTFLKSERRRPSASCSMLVRMSGKVLVSTAVVMIAVLVIYTDHILPTFVELPLYNKEKPFVAALILFPAIAVISSLMLFAGLSGKSIRLSMERNGLYVGDSVVATLFYRESRYQLMLMLVLSVVLGGVDYWYYFARYINANFNNPDRFFFCFIPVAVYVLSLIFMRGRYMTIQVLYESLEGAQESRRNSTMVRFLILSGNDLLLHRNPETGIWDTPAESVIGRTRNISDREAELLLNEQTGLRDFKLRYCFTNDGFASGANVIHYAAFLEESQRKQVPESETWFNAYMLDAALASNSLAPILANELYRIHTITMAWKTYDREGKRLYPIKNYRPTFRLGDMKKWDVDYDDHSWFGIAANNQDRRFYSLRKFWDSITGIFRRRTA